VSRSNPELEAHVVGCTVGEKNCRYKKLDEIETFCKIIHNNIIKKHTIY
jgi:hypothetical protein